MTVLTKLLKRREKQTKRKSKKHIILPYTNETTNTPALHIALGLNALIKTLKKLDRAIHYYQLKSTNFASTIDCL